MKLEDQCVSLELAKRLKELGVKQEDAAWYWGDDRLNVRMDVSKDDVFSGKAIAAFTVVELGEMLPVTRWGCSNLISGEMFLFYVDMQARRVEIVDKTEANARARLLILLLEKKYMEVPK